MKVSFSQHHPFLTTSCREHHYCNLSFKSSRDIYLPSFPPSYRQARDIDSQNILTMTRYNRTITSTIAPCNPLWNVVQKTCATKITTKSSLEFEPPKHLITQRWSNQSLCTNGQNMFPKKYYQEQSPKSQCYQPSNLNHGRYKHKHSQIMQQEHQPQPITELSRIGKNQKQNKLSFLCSKVLWVSCCVSKSGSLDCHYSSDRHYSLDRN